MLADLELLYYTIPPRALQTYLARLTQAGKGYNLSARQADEVYDEIHNS